MSSEAPDHRTPRGTAADGLRTARADLHCHSKHSDRSGEWYLRALSAPESVMEPLEIYRLCRRRGMDFVTVTDHDSIGGALEIAHLPGTFLSCEATVSFPEDGCRIHCLVYGVSEAQFAELDRLRGDLYAWRAYTVEQGIATSVAHPFYRVNDMLTLDHLERLLLLFDRFEARNGIHDGGGNELVEQLLAGLTWRDLERMANRHDLAPRGERPWVKHRTGGSDDHSGLYLATTWTETPAVADTAGFLEHLRAGTSAPGGETGSSHRLAQSIYTIADGYLSRDFGAAGGDPFRDTLRRLALPQGRLARARSWFSFLPGVGRRRPRPRRAPSPESTRRRAHRTLRRGVRRFLFHGVREWERGRVTAGLGSMVHLVPAVAAAAPYAFALRAQHKDEVLLRNARRHFGTDRPENRSKVWLTDTFGDINGVARTVETVARIAAEQGRDLTVVTCRSPVEAPGVQLKNFKPMAEFPWPGYKDQLGSLPPFLEMVSELEEMAPGEMILSTPGPVGLVGLYAARTLGCRLTGIYHTDFPAYIKHLLGGPGMEEMTWAYMRWFFGGMDRIYVRSAAYRDLLADNGFDRGVIHVMPRGVDTGQFSPEYRDRASWGGDPERFRFLYVGRVSKEKNLPALVSAFDAFRATGREAELVIVGDGPYRDELVSAHGHRADVRFTGVLRGEELATAYASADLFVFPSKTDTLGNVVIEAAASGVPAVVSNQGGPKELVRDGVSGLVVDVDREGALSEAMVRLYEAPELRRGMGKKALEMARTLSWDSFLADLWREERVEERVDEVAEAMGGGRVARIG